MEDAPEINAGFSIAMNAFTKALRAERAGAGTSEQTTAALDGATEAARIYGTGQTRDQIQRMGRAMVAGDTVKDTDGPAE